MQTISMHMSQNKPLTQQDIAWLDKILSKYGSEDSRVKTYVALDGFLTGILSLVSTILPSQWQPYIFGGTMPVWQSDEELRRFISLVTSRYNQICTILDNYPDQYKPFVTVKYNDGKEGLRPDDWATAYLYARENFDSLDAHIIHDEPAFLLKGFALIEKYAYSNACERLNELPPKKRDLEFKQLCQTILMIHHFYLKIRHGFLQSNPNLIMPKHMQQSPQPNSTPRLDRFNASAGHKIGRNDPCPCGSGKKYKKCCMLKQ